MKNLYNISELILRIKLSEVLEIDELTKVFKTIESKNIGEVCEFNINGLRFKIIIDVKMNDYFPCDVMGNAFERAYDLIILNN